MIDFKRILYVTVISSFLFFPVSAVYAIGGVTANCYGVIVNQSKQTVTLKLTAEHGGFYTGDQNTNASCSPLVRNNVNGPLTCTLSPTGRVYFELTHKHKKSSSYIKISTASGSAETYISAAACTGDPQLINIPKACAGGVCIFSNTANGIICDDPVPSSCH